MHVKTIAVYTKTTTKNKPSFSEYLSEGSKRHEIFYSLLKEHRKIIHSLLTYKTCPCVIHNASSIFAEWIVLKQA